MRDATTLAVFLAAWCGAPGSASAFTLHRTADGLPVHWDVPSVTYVVDASLDAMGPGALDAASRSFAAWEAVGVEGAPEVSLEKGVADDIGYRVGDENHNTIRYVPDGSPLAGGALAVTVLTFDGTGAIIDADVLINGAPDRKFAVLTGGEASFDDDVYVFDLEDVLTHEAGHSFGMAHNNEDDAVTMFPVIDPGELSKRTLSPDDEAGLRALYPKSQDPGAPASCAAGAGPRRGSVPVVCLVAGAAAALRARRRKARPLALAAALALLALGLGAGALASSSPAGTQEAAKAEIARVAAATPRWEGGLVVTRLTLGAARGPVALDVLGGSIDGVQQIVGGRAVPGVGEAVPVRGRGQEMVPTTGLTVVR